MTEKTWEAQQVKRIPAFLKECRYQDDLWNAYYSGDCHIIIKADSDFTVVMQDECNDPDHTTEFKFYKDTWHTLTDSRFDCYYGTRRLRMDSNLVTTRLLTQTEFLTYVLMLKYFNRTNIKQGVM